MRMLPSPPTLADAVRMVIESNRSDGYVPTRFMVLTENGHHRELRAVCERIISKAETLDALTSAITRYPTLLTLEDLVAVYGRGWGISSEVIEIAAARSKWFDKEAKGQRYVREDADPG